MTLREAHPGRHGECPITAAHMHVVPAPEPIVVRVAAEPKTVTVVGNPAGLTTALVESVLVESLRMNSMVVKHRGSGSVASVRSLAESLAVRLRRALVAV